MEGLVLRRDAVFLKAARLHIEFIALAYGARSFNPALDEVSFKTLTHLTCYQEAPTSKDAIS